MKMNKAIIAAAVTLALSGFAAGANAAALASDGSIALSIDAGTGTATAPTGGSYFAMVGVGGQLLAPGTGPGLVLGGTTANGEGTPTNTSVVAPWSFFTKTGYNRIDTTIGAVNSTAPSDNGDGTFNMGAWIVNWGGTDIDMSAGSAATFVCSSGVGNCQVGDTYTLDYSAVVPASGAPFNGITYNLHLTGTVSAVPAPAAVWLFGAGMIGLMGLVRRGRKAEAAGSLAA